MIENSPWKRQWLASPVMLDEPCRGCLILREVFTGGSRYTSVRERAMKKEVRETSAGAYCESCFSELPPCPSCLAEPSSHSEYPCLSCEIDLESRILASSCGRVSSPSYRGWSVNYHGKGQDNEPRYTRKIKERSV